MPKLRKREASVGVKRMATRSTETPCNSAANSLDPSTSVDLENVVVEKDVLTPEKVSDHPSGQGEEEQCLVRNLPDSVMLLIFGHLPVKELCRAACVCRWWNHLVRQKSLWKHVDLSPYKINLVNLRKLFVTYFSDSLRSLRLRGFLQSVKNTECISNYLLRELSSRSPNLQELCLFDTNLCRASSRNLPKKLETLKFFSCNYPPKWMEGASQQSKLNSLTHLDLRGSSGFGSRDLRCFTPATMKSLHTLSLGGCYRVRPYDIIYIARRFLNLEKLDLSKLTFTNEALQEIGTNLTKLTTLCLCDIGNYGNVQFDLLHLSPLKLLTHLYLRKKMPAEPEDVLPPFIGDNLVSLVNTLPKLELLLVSKNEHFTEDHVKKINNDCMMPRELKDGPHGWMISFYPRDKLNKIAEQQAH